MADNKPKVDTKEISSDLTKAVTNAITEGFKNATSSFSGLSRDLSTAITDGFKGGTERSKKFFEGKTLLEAMKEDLKEMADYQKQSAFQAKVQAIALSSGRAPREIELDLLNQAVQTKQQEVTEQYNLNKALGMAAYQQAKLNGDTEEALRIRKDLLAMAQEQAAAKKEAEETDLVNQQLRKKLVIQKQLEEQDKKKEAVNDKMKEVKKGLLAQLGITKNIFDQVKTPEMAKAIFAEQMAEKVSEAYRAMKEFKQEGMTAGQAIQAQFKGLSLMSMLGLSDTKGALKGFAQEYGSIGGISKDVVDEVGHMAHHFGIAGEEAAKLNAGLSQMPGETSKTAANAMKHVGHMAELQGINPGKIMKDMATNTDEMARYAGKGAEGFGKAVIEIHKMGVEIETASKMADGLLSFEDSINKQMEASVLLGRQINLDKAREYALNNDLEGVTREIARNIGGAGEFSKMNRLQQDALSKSVGMTTAELAKMMDAQQESNKYFGEGAGIGANLMGTLLEVGGGAVKLVKDYGMLALTLVQTITQYGIMRAMKLSNASATAVETGAVSGNIIVTKLAAAGEYALNVVKGIGITIKQSAIGMYIAERAAIVGNYIATTASTIATGAWNAIKFISNALGLTAVGTWIAETAAKLANVGATTAAAAATGTLAAVQETAAVASVGASGGIVAFGTALGAFGVAAAPAIPVILSLGAALLMATPAIYVIGEVIKSLATVIGNVLMKAIEKLPEIIGAVADGFVRMFAAVSQDIGSLLLLGPAMVMIGAGLGVMAIAGFAALPIIGALIGLAVVAPALVGLGNALGGMFGGGGGEESDQMDTLIGKVDQLIAVASSGGEIKMDGKKVGEVIRLGLNSAGVR